MAEATTLAEKIDLLFKTIKRPNGREHSMEEVANWCAAWLRDRNQARSFSKQYLSNLRLGKATNPTKSHLEALAAFFEVDAAIFLDSEKSRRIQADLELVAALKEADVHSVALRALSLTPANRAKILTLAKQLQADQAAERGADGTDSPGAAEK